jgi:hypothetical protein
MNKKVIWLLLILFFIVSCIKQDPKQIKKRSHPSHKYTYAQIDTSVLNYFETDYLPVYSDIYHQDGSRRFHLTTTVSIRNTSEKDSAYIISADYFDSYGTLMSNYVDSTIVLSPLESIEFVVEEEENLGGAGANFLINWGARIYSDQLLIHSVMISTYGQQGISFLAEAKTIEQRFK